MVFACATLWSCGPKQQAPASADSTATSTVAPEPTEKWLVLKYDDVRLRATPSKGGEVLASFKEGDQVLDLKERSDNQETVVLRGESITASWAKVRTKEGLEGWIFSGTLGAAPDPSIAAFAATLAPLPTDDCKSIQTALEAYAVAMKGKSTEIADQAVRPLSAFLDRVADTQNGKLMQRPDTKALEELMYIDEGKTPDPKASAEKKAWEDCGLQLDFPEGMLYLILKPGVMLPTVGTMVSDGMRRYLEICKKEDANPWSEDAGLIITPKELADRCVSWDAFLKDYPDFSFKTEIIEKRKSYISSLLIGENNTPAFEYDGKKAASAEFKAAWEWVLKTNAGTHTGKIVQEWCDMIKPGGWKMTPKSQKYIDGFWNAN